MPQPTRLDYCQYLLSSPINYTLTHLADHSQQFSHDMINRYLAGERIRPRLVWENVQPHLVQTEDGKTKLDHVKEMLSHSVYHKRLLFSTVLMDSWYAAKDLMLYIEQLDKHY